MRNPHRSKKKDWKNRVHFITKSTEGRIIKFKRPTFLAIKGIENGHVKNCTFKNVRLPIKFKRCKFFLLENCMFVTHDYKGKGVHKIPDLERRNCDYELEF